MIKFVGLSRFTGLEQSLVQQGERKSAFGGQKGHKF
jgi:hypothetical protein